MAITLVREAQSKMVSTRHGLGLRDESALAVGFPVDDLAVVSDHQDGAGQAALLDGEVDGGIEGGAGGEGLGGKSGGQEGGAP